MPNTEVIWKASKNDETVIQSLKGLEGIDELGYPIRLSLPYDVFPGSEPGGTVEDIIDKRSSGIQYQWNPPGNSCLSNNGKPTMMCLPKACMVYDTGCG